MTSAPQSLAVRGEIAPAPPLGREHYEEWLALSDQERAYVTPEAIERWTADLAPDDWTVSDVVRLERGRRGALRTLKQGAELTDLEWQLARLLARNEGRTVTYLQIARHLWGATNSGRRISARDLIGADGYASALVHRIHQLVGSIRRKWEIDPLRPQHLATIWAVGYRYYSRPPAADDGEDYDKRARESVAQREQLKRDLGLTDEGLAGLGGPDYVEGSRFQLGPAHKDYARTEGD